MIIKALRNLFGNLFLILALMVAIYLLVVPPDRKPMTLPTKPGVVTTKVYTKPIVKLNPLKKTHKPYDVEKLPFSEKKLTGVMKVKLKVREVNKKENKVDNARRGGHTETITLFRDDHGRWWYPKDNPKNKVQVEYTYIKHELNFKKSLYVGLSLGKNFKSSFTAGLSLFEYRSLSPSILMAMTACKSTLNIVAGGGVLYNYNHLGVGAWYAFIGKNRGLYLTIGYIF